jgi:lipopolysaccharide/colanic/teichoic acid biosynthesis glycosyltransferase
MSTYSPSEPAPAPLLRRAGPDAGAARGGAAGPAYEAAKRALDLVAAAALLAAAAPLMAAIAAAVRLTSPGPALFRQERLGRGGRPFACLKFRTMVRDAEAQLRSRAELRRAFEANYKIKDDPRLTPVGGLLRRYSLDELPQLWNVVRGEMSLIGPRPIVPPERAKYGEHAARLLSVKPGLGGMWQAYGRSDTTYDQRVALDLAYVEARSLWLDLKLLALTAAAVLRSRGAY